MKDIRINNRLNRVFVLTETETNIVYIPVKALHRIDYDRLVEIEQRGGNMLKEMQKTTLDNGRNALIQYDDIIQVLRLDNTKKAGKRVIKPNERETDALVGMSSTQPPQAADPVSAIVESKTVENESTSTSEDYQQPKEKPKNRGRGRPKGS